MRTETLFRATRQESKADITDRAAREIIEAETVARQQQMERLRASRLMKEAADRAAAQAASSPKAKKAKKAR